MAQRAKTTGTKQKPATGRPLGRPPGSKNKAKVAPAAQVAGRAARTAAPKSAAVPRKAAAFQGVAKPSKEELRQQVEKLERTVATLRARSREAVRAAKQAAARIEELEQKLRTQETKALRPAVAAPRGGKKPALAAGGMLPAVAMKASPNRGRQAKRDPGDAVPPGVAVEQPLPLDAEAQAALDSLEATIHPPNS